MNTEFHGLYCTVLISVHPWHVSVNYANLAFVSSFCRKESFLRFLQFFWFSPKIRLCICNGLQDSWHLAPNLNYS